jgi:serine/threonine protein kinase/Tfp pilus assembly protein PilF
MSLQPGTRVGAYEIISLIGKGGMGEVFRARDPRLDRDVAIKVLAESLVGDDQAVKRFGQEAKVLASLSHPNILTIYDIVIDQGDLFVVMELLRGETLRERMNRIKIEWPQAVQIAIPITEGIAVAHSHGIIHRDLKPENVFLTDHGQVKILDFGLAHVEPLGANHGQSWMNTSPALSHPGSVLGTLRTMAPEQLRGLPVDARVDIYSLGCILYEMISGHQPFRNSDLAELTAAILRDTPQPIQQRTAPKELGDLVEKCLEKNPDQRFASADEILILLRSIPPNISITAPASTARSRPGGKSVAILPIANSSGDRESEYLLDGITESIINSLSQLPKLKVTARSTAFRYKGKEIDPVKVGKDLSVRVLMTGRGGLRDDRIEIQIEMVKSSDGAQIWGQHFSKHLSDVFSVQEEIATQISTALQKRLTGAEKKLLGKRYTENVQAYQLYVKGRYYWGRRTPDAIEKAIPYFEQAIEIDPTYALAYSGIADCYNLLGWEPYGMADPKITYPRAIAAASKALEIDRVLAEGYNSLAWSRWVFNRDWQGAEEHYKRALKLNPGYAIAHVWYADLLAGCGRFEEALTEIKIAETLDPLAPITYSVHGLILYFIRDYEASLRQIETAIDLQADFIAAPFLKARVLTVMNAPTEAIALMEPLARSANAHPRLKTGLALAYASAGRNAEAKKILQELKEASQYSYQPGWMDGALVYSFLGEKETALEWLEKAYEEHAGLLVWLYPDPLADPLRSEPRFQQLIKRIGIKS